MIGPTVQVEAWIKDRLREPTLFDGVTTAEQRRERVRELIHRRQLHLAVAGMPPGTKACETWTALFQRVYGQPVEIPSRGASA